MLNSWEDGYGNSLPLQQSTSSSFEFGSSFSTGSNLDFNNQNMAGLDSFDFEEMDVDVLGMGTQGVSAEFDYEQAFVEAALSIGIHPEENRSVTFQGDGPTCPSYPNLDTISSTSGMLNAPTLPEAGVDGFEPQLLVPSSPPTSYPNIDRLDTVPVTVTMSSIGGPGVLSAPILPEPDSIHRRPTKRKKVNEVNSAHILPEGLQRSRTKSAKAAAALESAH